MCLLPDQQHDECNVESWPCLCFSKECLMSLVLLGLGWAATVLSNRKGLHYVGLVLRFSAWAEYWQFDIDIIKNSRCACGYSLLPQVHDRTRKCTLHSCIKTVEDALQKNDLLMLYKFHKILYIFGSLCKVHFAQIRFKTCTTLMQSFSRFFWGYAKRCPYVSSPDARGWIGFPCDAK